MILIAPERVIFARRREIYSRLSNRTPVNALNSLRTQDGAKIVLTQKSLYPFDSVVRFDVKASRAKDFTVSFRIPAWAIGAS